MKYIPLNNLPNVSGTRLSSLSPSLQLDDRSFPHICWLDSGNNINEVKYSYWDGLKWSYYDIPRVYISNESIVFSPNSLVLDSNDLPVIVFARKIGAGFRLSLADYSTSWAFHNLDVTYTASWIGVIKYEGHIDVNFSSSSSQSLSTSSSSSSSNELQSASSESSVSSSSSSYSNVIYYACVYDSTNEMFKIYSVDNGTWTLFGSQAATLDDCNTLKIALCGRRMGIAYVDNDTVIKYNFIDLDYATWSFAFFQDLAYSLSYGDILDMDIKGYWKEDRSIIAFGWLSRTSSTSYVCSVLCQDNGIETPSDGVSPVVENQNINVTVSSSDYIVNGYRKIGLSLNSQNLPALVTMGSSSGIFTLSGGSWTKALIDVEGISNGIVVNYLSVYFSVDTKISIATDSGDIYYFEPGVGSTFPLSTPSVFILNELWVYRAIYSSGSLSGMDISGTYNNMAGGILTDAQKPLLILSNKSTPVTTTTTTTTSP